MTEGRETAEAVEVLLGVSGVRLDLVAVLGGGDVNGHVVVVAAHVAWRFLHVVRLVHGLNELFLVGLLGRRVCGFAVAWLCKFGAD